MFWYDRGLAIGAVERFPGRNILIVDFGTATTLCAVSKEKEYIGGIITPGIAISMTALESKTARLPVVEIIRLRPDREMADG